MARRVATLTVWNGRKFHTLLEPEARKLASMNMVQIVDGSFTCLNARRPDELRKHPGAAENIPTDEAPGIQKTKHRKSKK